MIISKSNFAQDATVTVSPDSPTQDINVIVDGDFSSTYQDALQGQTTITIDFGELRNVEYIAIASNITTKDRVVIRSNATDNLLTSDGERIVDTGGNPLILAALSTIDDSTLGLNESRILMYKLQSTEVSDIVIDIYGSGQLKVTEVAVGQIYEVPNNGEQGGYMRPWGVPNIKNRSAINLQSAPINNSYESRSLSSTLQINYMQDSDLTPWDEFLQFSSLNTFYILEDDNKYHSYACFNGEPAMPKGDARTRLLNSVAIKFNAYARENEVIF